MPAGRGQQATNQGTRDVASVSYTIRIDDTNKKFGIKHTKIAIIAIINMKT
jgi:hypothetical protein